MRGHRLVHRSGALSDPFISQPLQLLLSPGLAVRSNYDPRLVKTHAVGAPHEAASLPRGRSF